MTKQYKTSWNKRQNILYKQYLKMTLGEIGSLLGMTREGVRQKLLRYAKWRGLARERLHRIGQAHREIDELKRQIRLGRIAPFLKDDPYRDLNTDETAELMAWNEIIYSSVRCMNALERLHIASVDSLLKFGIGRLARADNIGKKTITDITRILTEYKFIRKDLYYVDKEGAVMDV